MSPVRCPCNSPSSRVVLRQSSEMTPVDCEGQAYARVASFEVGIDQFPQASNDKPSRCRSQKSVSPLRRKKQRESAEAPSFFVPQASRFLRSP